MVESDTCQANRIGTGGERRRSDIPLRQERM